tara:strand:+ start:3091 stop:4620 length:1530 start_codon:yes stop_codon:yes gene_type:complete
MIKILTAIEQTNPKHLFWFIVAASIVLAAQMQAIQHGWINPDSVLYLEAAKHIVIGDIRGAYQIFNWPFYALCIGMVSKLTTFNVHLSAQLLNMVFFGVATASFLKIIQLAGGKNLALFAGALLLFGNLYIVGDVLEMLMRDEGFWAFYLTSLVFFIRFYQQKKISDALLWQVTAIIAVLFRIEAITFLLLLPLVFIVDSQLNYRQRVINLIKTYSISLLSLLIIFIAINTVDSLSIKNFGRLQEVFSMDLWSIFSQNLMNKSVIMSDQVLGHYLDEYAVSGLLLTFAYVIIVKNLTTLGLVSVVLIGMYLKNKFDLINSDVKRVLAATAIICLLNMALIITKVFVLSSRYVVALTLILLIVSALYLGYLFKEVTEKSNKRTILIVSIVTIIMCLSIFKNVLSKGGGYNYTQAAVTWVKARHDKQRVFYEDSRMRYYAGEPFIGSGVYHLGSIKLGSDNLHQYDYLVFEFGVHDQHKKKMLLQSLPEYKEVKRFYARKKKKYCAIYQKK